MFLSQETVNILRSLIIICITIFLQNVGGKNEKDDAIFYYHTLCTGAPPLKKEGGVAVHRLFFYMTSSHRTLINNGLWAQF